MLEPDKSSSLFVASLEKGMCVLRAFNCGEPQLSLNDITDITGLNKSAVQRFSHTWESLGYLKKDPKTKRYFLTPKSMDIAYSFLKSSLLIEIATPKLVDLKNRIKLSVNMSVLDGVDVIYILRFPSRRESLSATLTGGRSPAYCTAGGRAMLSYLPVDLREKIINNSNLRKITPHTICEPKRIHAEILAAEKKGYAINKEECMVGEIVIAAAVTNLRDEPIAAIHIAAPINKWPMERVIDELSPEILSVARSIKCP